MTGCRLCATSLLAGLLMLTTACSIPLSPPPLFYITILNFTGACTIARIWHSRCVFIFLILFFPSSVLASKLVQKLLCEAGTLYPDKTISLPDGSSCQTRSNNRQSQAPKSTLGSACCCLGTISGPPVAASSLFYCLLIAINRTDFSVLFVCLFFSSSSRSGRSPYRQQQKASVI